LCVTGQSGDALISVHPEYHAAAVTSDDIEGVFPLSLMDAGCLVNKENIVQCYAA